MKIKDGNVYCCGENLGKYERRQAYICGNCNCLFFTRYNPQRKIDHFLNDCETKSNNLEVIERRE